MGGRRKREGEERERVRERERGEREVRERQRGEVGQRRERQRDLALITITQTLIKTDNMDYDNNQANQGVPLINSQLAYINLLIKMSTCGYSLIPRP